MLGGLEINLFWEQIWEASPRGSFGSANQLHTEEERERHKNIFFPDANVQAGAKDF